MNAGRFYRSLCVDLIAFCALRPSTASSSRPSGGPLAFLPCKDRAPVMIDQPEPDHVEHGFTLPGRPESVESRCGAVTLG